MHLFLKNLKEINRSNIEMYFFTAIFYTTKLKNYNVITFQN